MTQYLFLFTIGPVQSFISQSRKTQDLYTSSFLLSHLIGSVMKELEGTVNECKFIFPNEEIKHKPNRFIAEIETNDIEQVGKDLKYFVENEFEYIANNVLNSSDFTYDDGFKDSFLEQIKTHLQIYWIARPLKEDNYSQIYKELESYLGAIKNVREFNQFKETGRKCSLCGERNVLFYRLTDKEIENGGLKLRKDGLLNKLYVGKKDVVFCELEEKGEKLKMEKGEGLCAVCFIKRFYNKDKCFPSTAEIAAMDWLSKIDEKNKNDYKDLFNNFDEQFFYEENLRMEYLEKYGHFKNEEFLSDAKKQLKGFYSIKDKNGNEIGKPPRYYALLMLDGDNMGKWLSGEFLQDEAKKNLKDFHVKMSKDLGNYAKNLGNNSKDYNENNDKDNRIIEPKGKLVYAGGDDVMTFANLGYLFNVLENLREKFPKFEKMKNDRNEKIVEEGIVSTASVGVVIAHYKTPLLEVLKWTRKMEYEAKENCGRDAFAIAVLKHSGEINKTVWKWDVDEKNESLKIKFLEDLIKELNDENEGFSNTFIKNLNIEFQKLDEIKDAMVETELKRLLNRSSQIKGDKKKKKIKEWHNKLFNLYINSNEKDNFLSFLNIADFIARRAK